MRWIHAVAAAVAATGLVTSVAKATLTVSLVPVPITAAAKSADSPNLDNARTYDLKVTQTGEKWNVGGLQTTLGIMACIFGTSLCLIEDHLRVEIVSQILPVRGIGQGESM